MFGLAPSGYAEVIIKVHRPNKKEQLHCHRPNAKGTSDEGRNGRSGAEWQSSLLEDRRLPDPGIENDEERIPVERGIAERQLFVVPRRLETFRPGGLNYKGSGKGEQHSRKLPSFWSAQPTNT